MIKVDELLLKDSCLMKAENEEMLFVLRAQDISSPKIVLEWIKENFETCSEEKLREAFECALDMRNHLDRKPAD
jgi:hypothetical protein